MAQHRLILVSVVLIGAMLVLVPWLTRSLGASLGYGIVFGIYWFGFCLPFGLAFQGLKQARQNLSLAVSSAPWVPWAVAGQVFLAALASWAVLPEQVPLIAVCVAAVAGLINGFAEEFYWRGAFLVQSQGKRWYQAVGVGLFTLWHVPLALAHGITYEGGPAALIGGALLLGTFWSIIANQTGRISWSVVAHVLTNMAAFVVLIMANFL